MAEYNVDDIFYTDGTAVFNEADVYSGIDETTALKAEINDTLESYVKKTGSVMSGALITPNIELTNMTSQLKFSDESIQNTALTTELITSLTTMETNTQYITKTAEDETSISGSVKVAKIIFPESLGEQNYPYTNSQREKTSAITYDSGLLQTSFANNVYANSLTCGNFNVSHLTGTISNLQTQLNNLQTQLDSMNTSSVLPAGTICMFAGPSANIPGGYLLCNGSLASKATYSDLYAAIGDNYTWGKNVSSSMFYLPDLRGMFVRGSSTNGVYTSVSGLSIGRYEAESVQKHSHKYDKANNTLIVVSSVSGNGLALNVNTSSVWDNSSDVMTTTYNIVDTDGETLLPDNETRPHNISMHYIIKT